jgi:hypothetical protein
MQENDDSQVNFVKYNMEKMAKVYETMGKDFIRNSEELN